MRVADYIGKEATHPSLGKVRCDSAPKGSKTQIEVTCIQRGKGWNEDTETYERYFVGNYPQEDGFRSLRWRFTNRDQYGFKDIVHIKTLSL